MKFNLKTFMLRCLRLSSKSQRISLIRSYNYLSIASRNQSNYTIINRLNRNSWRKFFRTTNLWILSYFISVAFYSYWKNFKISQCAIEKHKRLRPNNREELELFKAIRQNNLKKVDELLKNNSDLDVNARHTLGWTPLHLAAILGHAKIVKRLLDAGADPDAIDEFSNAGQIAYENRLNFYDVKNVREQEFSNLLANNVSFLGTTALHYACLASSIDTIQILMTHNANPNLENEFGHKPIDYLDDFDPNIAPLIPEMQKYCLEYGKYIEKLKMEKRRKFPLEQRLKDVIVGQDGAIALVSATIRRKENGWIDFDHPLVFLFLGSSGLGKTELAKQVAKYLHNNQTKGFIRIDMSEYQEKHEVAKFIGSPPGYIGYDQGGQLTKALTQCPNAVVLFDEVEKAHPDVLTIMLQLFDEGRLTDGQGKTIECKDAIFIMTSNLASDEIAEYGTKLRREGEELVKAQHSGKIINEKETENLEKVVISRYFKDQIVRPILKRHFKRDEFLGRINEMVYFLPFSRSELHQLVLRELKLWSQRAAERHKISMTWDSNVIGILANGYDVHYGARSIKYEVERRVINKISNAYENGFVRTGAKIHVVVSDDGEELKLGKLDIDDKKAIKINSNQNEMNQDAKLKLLIENPDNK